MDFEKFSEPFSGVPNAKPFSPNNEPVGAAGESVNSENIGTADDENPQVEYSAPESAAEAADDDATASVKDTDKAESAAAKETAAVTSEAVESIKKSLDDVACSTKGLGADLSSLASDIATMKVQISRLAAYDTLVENFRISLNANRTNEENLYKEVEGYRKDAYFNSIKPFLLFMVSIHCDMLKDERSYSEAIEKHADEEGKALLEEACKLIGYYVTTIADQLKLFGVTIVSMEPDTKYISGKQNIKKSVPTEDASKVGCIESVLSDCYMYGEKVLKAADVYVYTQK